MTIVTFFFYIFVRMIANLATNKIKFLKILFFFKFKEKKTHPFLFFCQSFFLSFFFALHIWSTKDKLLACGFFVLWKLLYSRACKFWLCNLIIISSEFWLAVRVPRVFSMSVKPRTKTFHFPGKKKKKKHHNTTTTNNNKKHDVGLKSFCYLSLHVH